MKTAIALKPTNVAVRATVVTPPVAMLDDQAAKEVFAAVVIDIEPAILARGARSTKECARLYKKARRFPDGLNLIRLARNIPSIKAWLYYEIERDDEGFDSDRAITGAYSKLQELAGLPGREGDEARSILRQMARIAAQ